MATAWEEQATLIDLDGTAPMVGTLRDCVRHFAAFKASAKADTRILLSRPVARVGRKTRTWILNPDEIEALAAELANAGIAQPTLPEAR